MFSNRIVVWAAGGLAILILAVTFFNIPALRSLLFPQQDTRIAKGAGTIPEQSNRLFPETPITPRKPEKSAAEQVKPTENTFNTPDIGSRIRAVIALRDRRDPESVRLLLKYLDDPENAVVSEAIDTLGYIGLNSEMKEAVFKALAEKARDQSFNLRGDALITSAMLGEKEAVLPLIMEFIAEDYEGSDVAAVRAMTFALSAELLPHIAKIIERNDNLEIQRNSFNLLARINTSEAVGLLQQYIRSDIPGEQIGSAWALSRQNDATHNRILTEAIANKTLQHEAVGEIAKSPAAAEVFSELFYRSDIEDQQKINWLKIVSNNVASATEEVRNSMADVTASLLSNPNLDIQRQALDTLGKAAASKDMTDAIKPQLESNNFLVQKAALEAFIQYLTPASYQPLKKLWFHEDEKMRRTAFFFSEPFLNQGDVPDLQKATQHKDQFIAQHSTMMLQYLTIPQ